MSTKCPKCGGIHVEKITFELENDGAELRFTRDRGRHIELHQLPHSVAVGLERVAVRIMKLLQTIPADAIETMPPALVDLILSKDVEFATLDPADFEAPPTTAPGGSA